ncbi:hypothetical protein BHF71_05190 [Vulcanibacillus modesticaldus]|uniref:RQC P-site tRNA stabilizing factor n=1 Tax=Vulcanibacillus modesticaldus TaxID=337097 RepID=A0A1D2YXC5_9BACI|nr:RNA-binding S4 domain-containing protein [Vulcanibacillus modesticaldus]OEG00300.1 hypothetical protein BHF71_05190 [Vulcanibacillus modesticaldus]
MRIDKFLKVSRIIKRRTLAKEVTDQGRIQVNGKTAKASTNVKEGDNIIIKLGQRKLTILVKEIKETSKKEEAAKMYEIIKEERISEEKIYE